MAAKIGTLTADLSLESAAFIRDLKKAADATARNTSAMQRSMAGVQKSFAGAAASLKGFAAGFISVTTIRSIVNAGKAAVDLADSIGDTAAALGVSTEALQRFRSAGEQADVSIERMDTALGMFQRKLAAGKIKDASFEAFIQRIREAPNQIEKVRVAQEGLGKQFQTGILLASQSAEEFRKNYEQASIISQDAIDKADTLSKSWIKVNEAVSTGFAEGVLDGFTGGLKLSNEQLEEVRRLAKLVGGEVSQFAKDVMEFARSIKSVSEETIDFYTKAQEASARGRATGLVGGKGGLVKRNPEDFDIDVPTFDASQGAHGPGGLPTAMAKAAEDMKALGSASDEVKPKVDSVAAGLAAAGAAAADMGAMHQMTADQIRNGWFDVASSIAGSLGTLFNDNKAFAIAQTVINTAQAIMNAMANAPWPLSIAAAGAAAIAGAAQIAQISRTNPGSGSSAPRPSTSGGSGRAAAASSAPATQSSLSIKIEGDGFLSRRQLENVMEQIMDAQTDGAKIVMAPT